jgi:ABC-type transport system involved in cytochrome c biogenesis permease subunit
MLSGVSIICFAGSYTVALALELTRLLFRSRVRWPLMVGFAAAGLFAHSVYLYHRAVVAAGAPLSSQRDWYLLAAWVLAAIYLYLTCYHPHTSFGLFLLPLVLGLLGTARFFADSMPFLRQPASAAWGAIHGVSILLAVVAVLVGFATGLMYLHQAWRLKQKRPPVQGLRLPSLEWLHRANQRAIALAVVLFGLGLISGMILNEIHSPRPQGRLPWDDPIVLSTLVTFGWLLVSLAVTRLTKSVRQGPKVAYFTVVSFLILAIALGVGLFVHTQHGGSRQLPEGRVQGSGFGVRGSGFRLARPLAAGVDPFGVRDLGVGGQAAGSGEDRQGGAS